MTTILVHSGESVRICFVSSGIGSGVPDTGNSTIDDGSFEVHYDSKEHPHAIVVKETAGLAGSKKGGANEILYEEYFGEVSYDKNPPDQDSGIGEHDSNRNA